MSEADPRDARIRPVRPEDIERLLTLCAAHAAYEGAPYEAAGKAEALTTLLFGSHPRLRCLVVEGAEELVGYATWSEEASTWAARSYVHMDCLYLEPGARGRGLGKRLVAAVARDALASGMTEVQWQTPVANEGARRFYRRLGAAPKRKVRFFLRGEALRRAAEGA